MSDSASAALESRSLLHQLRRQVSDVGDVPPIPDADYMRCHTAFEGASDQQGQILDWLIERLTQDLGSHVSLVSIGAGSGLLDVPLIAHLAARATVRYVVIEPIEEQCARFAERFAAAGLGGRVDLQVINAKLEDLGRAERFDYVLAIHSVYYMDDLDESIRQLAKLRRPDGKLLIAQAPLEDMNLLAEVFWNPQQETVHFGQDVEECLRRRGDDLEKTRLDGQLTVSLDASHASPTDAAILDFLIQARLERLPESTRELVFRYLKNSAASTPGGRSLPHPVTLFEVG